MRTDGAHLQPAFPELGKTLAAGVWYIDRQVPQPVYVVEPIDSPPVATTLFIHGICEHGARYLQFARHLAGIRIRTILFDLKGHGLDVDEPEPFRAVALAYAETPDPAEREARLASVFGSEEGLLRRAQRDHFLRLRILTMRDHLDQVEALARVANAGPIRPPGGVLNLPPFVVWKLVCCTEVAHRVGCGGAPSVGAWGSGASEGLAALLSRVVVFAGRAGEMDARSLRGQGVRGRAGDRNGGPVQRGERAFAVRWREAWRGRGSGPGASRRWAR